MEHRWRAALAAALLACACLGPPALAKDDIAPEGFDVVAITHYHAEVRNHTPFRVTVEISGIPAFVMAPGGSHLVEARDVARRSILRVSYKAEDADLFRDVTTARLRDLLGGELTDAILTDPYWTGPAQVGVAMPTDPTEKDRQLTQMKAAENEAFERLKALLAPVGSQGAKASVARLLWRQLAANGQLLAASQGQLTLWSERMSYEQTQYGDGDSVGEPRDVYADAHGGEWVSPWITFEIGFPTSTVFSGVDQHQVSSLAARMGVAVLPELRIADQVYLRPMLSVGGAAERVAVEDPLFYLAATSLAGEGATSYYVENGDGYYGLKYGHADADLVVRASIRPRTFVEAGVGTSLWQEIALTRGGTNQASGDEVPEEALTLSMASVAAGLRPYKVLRVGVMWPPATGISPFGGVYVSAQARTSRWASAYAYIPFADIVDARYEGKMAPDDGDRILDLGLSVGVTY